MSGSPHRKSNREYQRVSTKRKTEHIGNILGNLGITKSEACENSFSDLVKVAMKITSLWQLHSVSPVFVHEANIDAVNALLWFLYPDNNMASPSVLACKGDALTDLELTRKTSQTPLIKRERNKMTKYRQFWRKRVFCRTAPVVLHRILVHLALLESTTEPILSDGDSVSHKKALQLLDTYSSIYLAQVGMPECDQCCVNMNECAVPDNEESEDESESPVDKKPRLNDDEVPRAQVTVKQEPDVQIKQEHHEVHYDMQYQSMKREVEDESASWLQCAMAQPKMPQMTIAVQQYSNEILSPIAIDVNSPVPVTVQSNTGEVLVNGRRCRDPNDHEEFVNMVISGPYSGLNLNNDITVGMSLMQGAQQMLGVGENLHNETRAVIDSLSASLGLYNPGLVDNFGAGFGNGQRQFMGLGLGLNMLPGGASLPARFY